MRPLVNPACQGGEAETDAEIRGIPLPVGNGAAECQHLARRLGRLRGTTLATGSPAGQHARRHRRNQFMKIRPLQDRIFVERIDEEEMSKGGILIPDTAKEKPQEGKVVAVGKGKVLENGKIQKLDVQKGDRVLFSKYGGTEITLEGEERLILREDDVLGILE